MLYLSGSSKHQRGEQIMEQVAMALNEEQQSAAEHIKKDFKKKPTGRPKSPPKTPAQKKAKVKQLSLLAKDKAKKIPKEKKTEKAGERKCLKCKSAKPRTSRSLRCGPCQREVRKAQLARNNVTWRKRLEQGKAKNHATYRGKPTVWAALHPEKALSYAKKHGILPVEKVKKVIDQYGKKIAAQAQA